jgi:Intein splicing domain/tRNA-splicing ligase RtcB
MNWKDFAILHEDGYFTLATEETGDVPVRLFLTAQLLDEVEDDIYKQIVNATRFPGVKLVCITPDVHVGYGVPIGCVLVTDGTLCLGPVGYDIGCFIGDTLIPLADGISYPIKELAEKNEEFWCFALNPKHKVEVARATAQKTRVQAPLIKVILDNEREIICTPDHQFMLRDGTYCEAQYLNAGSSLMPFYYWQDKKGYNIVNHPKTGMWQRIHWIIGRQGLLGKIPSFEGQRTIIHHRNFTPTDNRPENLEFMGDKDHMRYHSSLKDHRPHFQSPEFERARKAAISAMAKTEEGRALLAKRGTANILKYMQEQPEHFKASVAGNGQRGKQYLLSYNSSEKGRKKSSEVAHREYTREICGAIVVGGFGIHNHRRYHHGYNHRVVSVELLNYTEDVDCLVNDHGDVPLDEAGPCYKSSEEVIEAVVSAGLATVQYRLWPLASLKGLK